mgnify:CR=1 FL=1
MIEAKPWREVATDPPPFDELVLTYDAHGYALMSRCVYNKGEKDEAIEWDDAHGSLHDGDPPLWWCTLPLPPGARHG